MNTSEIISKSRELAKSQHATAYIDININQKIQVKSFTKSDVKKIISTTWDFRIFDYMLENTYMSRWHNNQLR